jgi:hypothetical protein
MAVDCNHVPTHLPSAEMSDDARPMAPLLEIDQASKHFGVSWRRAASPRHDLYRRRAEPKEAQRLRISTGVMPITRDNVAQFKHT